MTKKCDLQFAVLGLGRFGLSIVKTLSQYDVNILACDKDPARLHEATDYATHVVQANVEDADALIRLGIGNFDVVILTMGGDFEALVMGTMIAKELGAGKVVVRAFAARQKKILERIGADHVVLPEVEMGSKVAVSLMNPSIMDILEQTGNHVILEMHPEQDWIGKTIHKLNMRKDLGYTVLALIRNSETIFPVDIETPLIQDDILIVLSENKN